VARDTNSQVSFFVEGSWRKGNDLAQGSKWRMQKDPGVHRAADEVYLGEKVD
jgi:hypothetical protein